MVAGGFTASIGQTPLLAPIARLTEIGGQPRRVAQWRISMPQRILIDDATDPWASAVPVAEPFDVIRDEELDADEALPTTAPNDARALLSEDDDPGRPSHFVLEDASERRRQINDLLDADEVTSDTDDSRHSVRAPAKTDPAGRRASAALARPHGGRPNPFSAPPATDGGRPDGGVKRPGPGDARANAFDRVGVAIRAGRSGSSSTRAKVAAAVGTAAAVLRIPAGVLRTPAAAVRNTAGRLIGGLTRLKDGARANARLLLVALTVVAATIVALTTLGGNSDSQSQAADPRPEHSPSRVAPKDRKQADRRESARKQTGPEPGVRKHTRRNAHRDARRRTSAARHTRPARRRISPRSASRRSRKRPSRARRRPTVAPVPRPAPPPPVPAPAPPPSAQAPSAPRAPAAAPDEFGFEQ